MLPPAARWQIRMSPQIIDDLYHFANHVPSIRPSGSKRLFSSANATFLHPGLQRKLQRPTQWIEKKIFTPIQPS